MSEPSTLPKAPATLPGSAPSAAGDTATRPPLASDSVPGAVFGTSRQRDGQQAEDGRRADGPHGGRTGGDRSCRVSGDRASPEPYGGGGPDENAGALLHRFYKVLDRFDAHAQDEATRLAEIDERVRAAVPEALAEAMPELEAALFGEASSLAAHVRALTARLDEMQGALEELLARPVPDPGLGEEVAGARRRLSEDLTRRTAAIHQRMELLAADTLRKSPAPAAELPPRSGARLDAIESRLGGLAAEVEAIVPGLRDAVRGALAEAIATEAREAHRNACGETLHGNLSN